MPLPRRSALVLALSAWLLAAPGAGAQTELIVDNDLFGLRGASDPPPDRDYTHGTRLRWGGASSRWEVGQRIYTPRVDSDQPVPGERPYAGWLYGAWEGARIHGAARTHAQVEAGFTGPATLAGEVQSTFHRLAGYRAVGWRNQLPFEPSAAVTIGGDYRVAREVGRARVELVPGASVGAGTLWTGATARVRARAGFGAGDSWTGRGARRGWSGWMEAGARGDAVARDLFLDGTLFRPSHRVQRRPWVAQGEAAAAVRWKRVEVEYRFVVRGREYQEGRPHPYGSVRLRLW